MQVDLSVIVVTGAPRDFQAWIQTAYPATFD